MADFLHCKVNLNLKDGSTSTGTITFVDNNQITLKDATNTIDPSISFPSITIPNAKVADLKILQVPSTSNGNGNGNGNGNSNSKKRSKAKNSELVDDAILFASKPSRSTTPKPKSSGESSHGTNGKLEKSLALDVDDVKNSEFDFQANLAMFDKKSVFDSFRKNDHTQLSDRLVGQNKIENIAKPKKEKYDNNEMVLDSQPKDNWDSIGKSIDRQKTETPTDSVKNHGAQRQLSQERIKMKNFALVNAGDLKPMQTASPVQLLEIERLAEDVFGVSPTMMTEACATNLSKLIIDTCLGGSIRLSNKNNHNLPPLVLLLIGSGRCGSRAFATGRHLNNHGVRVLAFVISSDESDKELHQQWQSFEAAGGKVISSNFDELVDIIQNQLNTPVELIVDALQGYDDHLEDIFYELEDQKTLQKVINWCSNPQQQQKIMSLDLPSGIDGGSGTLSDENTKIECRWCISMGLPLSGIILAYKNGVMEHQDVGGHHEILHYLVDVGIPNKVYLMKPNLRKFDKFWYCAETCIKLDVAV